MASDELDVVDTWVDGGREVFLIAGGELEALADFSQCGDGGGLGGQPPSLLGESIFEPIEQFRLGVCEEDRQTDLVGVVGAVALGVVHQVEFYSARAELGIGNGTHGEAAVDDGGHHAAFAFDD